MFKINDEILIEVHGWEEGRVLVENNDSSQTTNELKYNIIE